VPIPRCYTNKVLVLLRYLFEMLAGFVSSSSSTVFPLIIMSTKDLAFLKRPQYQTAKDRCTLSWKKLLRRIYHEKES
jgi:hypothetical protein